MSPIDRDDLHRQFCALVDGAMSASEQEQLERLLAGNAEARAEYREFMYLESLLAWNIAAEEERLRLVPEISDATDAPPARDQRRIAGWLLPLAVSAMAAAAATVAVVAATRPTATDAAVLTAEDHAVWRGDDCPVRGKAMPAGLIGLAAGNAQITLPSGAVIAVHAGAEFELLGSNRLFLRAGRVTPYVPPSAKGFTLVSPGGEVVDFGTEFTVGVDRDGRTDVFVIDGEVDVAGGHVRDEMPVRLTQGFASQFAAAERTPVMTQEPLVIDHFEATDGALTRRDVDPDRPSSIIDGWLSIPFGCGTAADRCNTRVVLGEDFSSLVGRKSTISFKAMLPNAPDLDPGRWFALVIDNGDGEPPMAATAGATAAVLMSPKWQAGMRFDGEIHKSKTLFPRAKGTQGPYQVVLTIDDRPETRAKSGGASLSLMINGLDFVQDRPVDLGPHPRLTLQTSSGGGWTGRGVALVDDLSISTDIDLPQTVPVQRLASLPEGSRKP